MKKILVVLMALMLGTGAFAETLYFETDVNMKNYWEKNGKDEQKVMTVAQKILYANKINKRIPLEVKRNTTTINATSNPYYKTVTMYTGMLPYFDNDDELAYVLSHEIAHSIDSYGGAIKLVAMNVNSKSYEMKADLKGIDYMVTAGYNPVAAIIMGTKLFQEPIWDWGFTSTHPKGSKRVMAMYKYIYKKYPQYLTSEMTKNIVYQNFLLAMDKEIKAFHAKEKSRNHIKNGDL